MPIYEYRCESCGHELDALQKLADDPLKDCPACEDSSLRRLVSAPSFRLKGQGWYETDFKSEKETRRNLVESQSDAKGDKKAKDGETSPKDTPGKKANLSSDSKGSSAKSDSGSTSGSGSNSGSDSRSNSRSNSKSKGSGSGVA